MRIKTKFFKNNYKKLISSFCLVGLIGIFHPKFNSEYWSFLLGINNRTLVFALDVIVNLIIIAAILFLESKIKLRDKFTWLTRNISEYRIGFVCFATLLVSLAVLIIILLFISRYIKNDIISGYLFSYIVFTYIGYILYILEE